MKLCCSAWRFFFVSFSLSSFFLTNDLSLSLSCSLPFCFLLDVLVCSTSESQPLGFLLCVAALLSLSLTTCVALRLVTYHDVDLQRSRDEQKKDVHSYIRMHARGPVCSPPRTNRMHNHTYHLILAASHPHAEWTHFICTFDACNYACTYVFAVPSFAFITRL